MNLVDNCIKTYCFLGIDYILVNNKDTADIVIYPRVNIIGGENYVGYTNGTIIQNRKFYPTPEILLSAALSGDNESDILTHELYHFLAGAYHNILDTESIMYPVYEWKHKNLSRSDSLYIQNAFMSDYERMRFWRSK